MLPLPVCFSSDVTISSAIGLSYAAPVTHLVYHDRLVTSLDAEGRVQVHLPADKQTLVRLL